jgi:hypothetical protein
MTSHTKCASFLLVILTLSSLSAAETRNRELSLTVVSQPYTIELVGEYHRITMEEFYTRGIPGNPVLPQQVYTVEVPYNCNLESVHLSVLSQDSEEISGLYEIGPSPLPGPGGTYSTDNGKNTQVYTKDALYPLSPVEMRGTSQVRDKKYVKVQFTPFQYNPITKVLVLNKEVTLSISWSTYYTAVPPLTAGTGYVIVTTNAVVSNSTHLNAFKTYLQRRGFTVYTVTENQYGAAQGQARALNIRNWLQTNYLLYNIKYVLLIGNPDPDNPLNALDIYGDIPMMMCWPNPGSSADSTPTDYFYADLTGNWDSDSDTLYGEFGEDAVDFGPDVYVGRIPVYGNYAVLDTILTKFMNYTGANTKIMLPMAMSNYQDEQNGANGCVAGWGRTDGLNVPQEVITNIANPAGFYSFVMYETAGVTGKGHDPVPVSAFGYKAPLINGIIMSGMGT